MANFPFFSRPHGAGPQFEFLSDVGAAEREVESYFTRLAAQPKVEPEAAAPFDLDDQRAVEAYTKWLHGLSFAPGDLKKFADLGALKATYVPFWIVNAMTYTKYQGERGVNYQDTERTTDAQGHVQTRQVTKTRWSPINGEITHYFEHLLICGKAGLPAEHTTLLTPTDLAKLGQYTAGGHKAIVEPYTVDPKSAFNQARTVMEAEVRKLCTANIGGDQQKVNSAQTRYVGVSVHHVLVPCYQGGYRYKDKSYNVLINAVTGQVTGDRPYSGGKIAILVLVIVAIVLAIAAAVYFFVIAPNMRSELPDRERPAAGHVASADGAAEGMGRKTHQSINAMASAKHECACIGRTDAYNGVCRVGRGITTCRLLKLEIVG